ncbi:MAG: MarR family winged helix-turn-helix transcriptional regulator [Eubacteriales bacterium]
MRRHENMIHHAPPERKELNDTPTKLCNEISRLFHSRLRRVSDHEGVMSQPGAGLVLSYLAVKDGITQLELVNATHLKAPSVSVILKKMEEEKIVERRTDTSDMRATRVFLTEHGRDMDRKHIELIKSVDALAMSGIDDADVKTVMEILTKIRDNLVAQSNL